MNTLAKIILWSAGTLAISAITIFVLYRLAMLIAMAASLLLLGLLVGPPLFMAIKYKYSKMIAEYKASLEDKEESS
jgi:hypothetical protein